jgi:ABC-type nitrate/sulfonate/bicarbonate transport system substrate-binding protein
MKRNLKLLPILLALPLLALACSKTKTSETTVAPETSNVAETIVAAPAADSAVASGDSTVAGSSSETTIAATVTTAAVATSNGKLTPVTLVLDWTPNTNHSGFYVAKENGFYKDNGLDVTIIEPGADGGLAQLAAGNAQFAVSVAESLLPARAAGANVISVASIIQHNTSSLIIPADRGIARPKDLEGKTYGGFGGPLEKALIDKLVTCDGGDPTKVKYVEIGNVDYKVGLERKDYDAVWVFDGWDAIRLSEIDGRALVSMPFFSTSGATAGCIPDWYTPLLATSEAMIADKPELVRSFVTATAKGFELARTDAPAAAAALLEGAPELDKVLVQKSAAYLATRYADAGAKWGVQDPVVWSAFSKFLSDNKILESPVDTAKVFTNGFLPK